MQKWIIRECLAFYLGVWARRRAVLALLCFNVGVGIVHLACDHHLEAGLMFGCAAYLCALLLMASTIERRSR